MMTLTRLQSLQRQFIEDGFNDVRDSEVAQIVEMAISSCELTEQVRQLTEQRDALVSENVGLKRIPKNDSVAMLLALDSFRSESLPDVGLQKAFETLMYHRETPATDAAIAALRAEVLPPNIAEIIDSGELESILFASEASYSEEYRMAFYNFRQLRESKGEVSNG